MDTPGHPHVERTNNAAERALLHAVIWWKLSFGTQSESSSPFPAWLSRYSHAMRRLAESVAQRCRILPIKHVADYFGLHWGTVKAIDNEFAIQKGHRYATVIVDPDTKRVLGIGRGRGREDIRPFFELLGSQGRGRLKAVVMDMNGAYEQEVMGQCARAEIVFDLFHVVAKFGREVIDRVRVDEADRLRHDKPARSVIKQACATARTSPSEKTECV